MYRAPRFHIDVYFWLDGTTSIHQHGFCGAFQVLSGSSLQSLYTFEQEEEINAHFSAGRILLNEVQLLAQGDIRPIFSGRQFIHSLFHLDRPSATITVRTNVNPKALPQYDYLKPHFALDPFFKDPSTLKQFQSVLLLLRMNHPEADSMLGEFVASADFQTTFSILNLVFQHLVDAARERIFHETEGREHPQDLPDESARFNELFDTARRRHGPLMDLLPPVLNELQRQSRLFDLRKHMTSSEHRFFLALLLNVPYTTPMLGLVKQRFPQRDPVDTLCDWVMQFSTLKVFRSPEPNVLGVDDFSEIHLLVFRYLLKGFSAAQIKDALKQEHSLKHPGILGDELEKIERSLRNSILLKWVFDDAPPVIHQECLPPIRFAS